LSLESLPCLSRWRSTECDPMAQVHAPGVAFGVLRNSSPPHAHKKIVEPSSLHCASLGSPPSFDFLSRRDGRGRSPNSRGGSELQTARLFESCLRNDLGHTLQFASPFFSFHILSKIEAQPLCPQRGMAPFQSPFRALSGPFQSLFRALSELFQSPSSRSMCRF